MSTIEAHFAELQQLQENHSSQAAGVNEHADKAFQSSYKVGLRWVESLLAMSFCCIDN